MKRCPKSHNLSTAYYQGIRKPAKFIPLESRAETKDEEPIVWAFFCERCDDYYFERELLRGDKHETK